jgi:hypothetical protein
MLFGLLKDKSSEHLSNTVSCALCLTVVSQGCATLLKDDPHQPAARQFACFRCFAEIIVQRRQLIQQARAQQRHAA